MLPRIFSIQINFLLLKSLCLIFHFSHRINVIRIKFMCASYLFVYIFRFIVTASAVFVRFFTYPTVYNFRFIVTASEVFARFSFFHISYLYCILLFWFWYIHSNLFDWYLAFFKNDLLFLILSFFFSVFFIVFLSSSSQSEVDYY